eukprot:5750851-Karenia_brevis.AAC.1
MFLLIHTSTYACASKSSYRHVHCDDGDDDDDNVHVGRFLGPKTLSRRFKTHRNATRMPNIAPT